MSESRTTKTKAETVVKEYWLADPIYRTVEQYVLEHDGKYRYAGVYTERDAIDSPTIPCLSIALDAIFPPEKQ